MSHEEVSEVPLAAEEAAYSSADQVEGCNLFVVVPEVEVEVVWIRDWHVGEAWAVENERADRCKRLAVEVQHICPFHPPQLYDEARSLVVQVQHSSFGRAEWLERAAMQGRWYQLALLQLPWNPPGWKERNCTVASIDWAEVVET